MPKIIFKNIFSILIIVFIMLSNLSSISCAVTIKKFNEMTDAELVEYGRALEREEQEQRKVNEEFDKKINEEFDKLYSEEQNINIYICIIPIVVMLLFLLLLLHFKLSKRNNIEHL